MSATLAEDLAAEEEYAELCRLNLKPIMNFRPLNSYIQIEPVLPQQKHGSLYLVQSAQPQPTRGVVVAVGPGKLRDDLTLAPMPNVAVGDTIAFTPGSLQVVKAACGYVYLVEAQTLLGVEQ